MTGRLLPFCFLTFSILPPASFAQSKNGAESVDYSNDVVSVHALSIPDKARNDYNKGVRHLIQKDWAASVPDFQHAIKSFPNFFEAYDMLGVAQLAMQNWSDAEAAFRQSIELSHGTYGPPHFGLGLILCIDHKQYADAEAAVREGLDSDPADADGHFALAWVLYSMSRFHEAEQSAREAVRCKPSFAEPYLLLAQIHLHRNEFAPAIADLDGYLKLDPNGPRSARMRSVRAAAQQALASETSTATAPANR
jgi:tetratricopeptide (TPR) repeat protein